MVNQVAVKPLARYSLEVLRERALLALRDPAGETEAVVPLDVEQATYNLIAASAELASRRNPYFEMVDRMYADQLDAALGVPAGRRKGQMRCPAHDDRTASLSWARNDRGTLLVYCHAGCTFDDIRRAVL